MKRRSRRFLPAIVCGLGLAASLGCATVARADEPNVPVGEYTADIYSDLTNNTSTGETNLYIVSGDKETAVSEGSHGNNVQLRVSVPVGIHYVALKNGVILGPSDGKVMFRNLTEMSAVHIAGIAVSEVGPAKIVSHAESETMPDGMSLTMCPMLVDDEEGSYNADQCTHMIDEFANYVGTAAKSPVKKYEWDIPVGGRLSLFDLGGFMGSFDKLNPLVDTQVGTVHWTIRLGTRAEADERDSKVTIRYHANGGVLKAGAKLNEQRFTVVDPVSLPKVVPQEDVLGSSFVDATDILEKTEIEVGGTLTKHVFCGWSRDAAGKEPVNVLSDIGSAEELAGKSYTLYANYEVVDEEDGD